MVNIKKPRSTKDLYSNMKREGIKPTRNAKYKTPHPRPLKKGSKESSSQPICGPLLVLKHAPITLPPQDPH